MVVGVTEGYEKKLEIVGTGYRVLAKGSDLEFALGLSHPVVVTPPEGITFAVESQTRFSVQGIDDTAGRTLASASSMEADLRGQAGDKTAKAKRVGALVAERAKAAGVE